MTSPTSPAKPNPNGTLLCRLVRPPEAVQRSAKGTAWTRFGVATGPRDDTAYYDVVAFGDAADHLVESGLDAGTQLVVIGRSEDRATADGELVRNVVAAHIGVLADSQRVEVHRVRRNDGVAKPAGATEAVDATEVRR